MNSASGMNGFKGYHHAGNSGLQFWPHPHTMAEYHPGPPPPPPPSSHSLAGVSYYADTTTLHHPAVTHSSTSMTPITVPPRSTQVNQVKHEFPSPPAVVSVASYSRGSPAPVSVSTTSSTHSTPTKKKATPTPDELKDTCYWERRKKNNLSAKRSREARRGKEQATACRVVYLEQENLQLRTEVSLLRSEIDKLRCILYGH